MNQRSIRSSGDAARVLLFSMRNIAHHVARCHSYEFEDVICRCEHVDVIGPAAPSGGGNRIGRYVKSVLRGRVGRLDGEFRAGHAYELFFAYCHSVRDLRYVERVEGLYGGCRRRACVIGELWPHMIPNLRASLRMLSTFDCLFSNLESSVDAIQDVTGRPCYFLPFGVDALLFCPYPKNPPRTIDVYNMGRRHEDEHRVLMAQADCGEIFYVVRHGRGLFRARRSRASGPARQLHQAQPLFHRLSGEIQSTS